MKEERRQAKRQTDRHTVRERQKVRDQNKDDIGTEIERVRRGKKEIERARDR